MAITTRIATTWAVLDADGRVVVLFSGEEAWAEAQVWAGRGYTVAEAEPLPV